MKIIEEMEITRMLATPSGLRERKNKGPEYPAYLTSIKDK